MRGNLHGILHSILPRASTLLSLALACALLLTAAIPAHGIERRRDQYPKEPAYFILPFPFNLPGIGSGIAVTGLAANIGGSNADVFGILITGDVSGNILTLEELHLIEETLIFRVSRQDINSAFINSYDSRGIDSDPDSFNLLEISQADSLGAEVCLCLFNRRLQLSFGFEKDEFRLASIRDSDGNLIQEFTDREIQKSTTRRVELVLDFTDDWEDPRKGVRLSAERRLSPPDDTDDPDFSVTDISLNLYIPVGRVSTFVVNYFQSDATVERQGETDPTALEADLGITCDPGDVDCEEAVRRLIEQAVAANTYGTATSLGGGFSRLRSYPQGRFQGAHTVFYGAEFRWNITDESTPFNYFIWKDVRTNVQMAFFAETGSVAETRDALDKFKSSYGVGLRVISASGFVYRADLADGDEGTEFVLIFGYPF